MKILRHFPLIPLVLRVVAPVYGYPNNQPRLRGADVSGTDMALESIRAKYHLPGLAGARVPADTISSVSARAVGYRKQGNDTALTVHDQFHLGSLTKAMTATLLAMLISDATSHLTWETKIGDAFPHFTNVSTLHKNTTLAMLGSHFSGISDLMLVGLKPDVWNMISNQSVSPVEGRKLVTELALSYPPATTPGANFSYSNVGYMVLGHLLETHGPSPCSSWENLIQKKLWGPLGMTSCGFGTPPERTLQSIDNPWPHRQGNPDPIPVTPDRFSDNPPAMGPAGTVHCGIESYSKFLALHLDGLLGHNTSLLPAEAFGRLHTPYLAGVPASRGPEFESLYTPGAWVVAGPDERVNGSYLFHDGSNLVNFAYGLLAPGVGEAYFSATNVGGDEASAGANEVLIGFFDNSLGF